MVLKVRKTISDHRKRLLPGLVALSLLAGVVVSIVATPNAQADYNTGCGYGYSSTGTGFGYGTGAAHAYGYANGSFGYGYGNEVCPLSIAPSSLPGGIVGTGYNSGLLTGSGGTGTYGWTESGALDGLSFANGATQYIYGTPLAAGTFPITITITDGNGVSFTQAYSILISSAGGGGTTTTTASTTTTTTIGTTTTTVAPTTTTTVAAHHSLKPVFLTIQGRPAYIGKTTLFTIHGLRLTGLRVSSTGARVKIVSDSATVLKVHVKPIIGKKPGVYQLRGTNSHGTATIFYSQFYRFRSSSSGRGGAGQVGFALRK